ncbi:glycosyltransferase 87 family protein [Streptomyces sp. AS02]|uniref:glycosyltransferase 87 family protein n=1 Tax=Streptomyces sp. AS02 TaxID=2938946 RepID=UPI00201FDF67|nr:glycosyltransferase 87 family protein [Streptomyces sp. AS02]MCL8011070.1 glycosyltransferase 87 family protein [Streptomyces sp. AS02]
MPPESLTLAAGARPGGSVLAPARQEAPQGSREPSRRVLRVRRDVLFWLGCAGFALTLAVVTALTPHRIWGVCAAVGYAVAAELARRSPRPWGRRGAVAALLGSVVVPLVLMVAVGAGQSEVHVVERAGGLLLDSGSPYLPHPADVDDYNPYLPGMALFGIPHALFDGTPLADARVWFCAAFVACMVVSARRTGRNTLWRGWASGIGLARGTSGRDLAHGISGRCTADGTSSVNAVLLLAAFPAVALPLAVGGVDLPVIGLMCLGLALAGRGGSGTAAGLAMGAAAALKWTAWPLLPVGLVLLAVTAGRRAAVRAGVVAVLVAALAVVPVALANPHAFVEHVVLFPLGEGGVRSPAASPLPGYLLATYVPGGSVLAMAALAVAAVGVAVSLAVRPPRTVVAAADRLAIGLGLAMCLIPATRFGYLVYPLVLAVWFRRTELVTAVRRVGRLVRGGRKVKGGPRVEQERRVDARWVEDERLVGAGRG